MVCVVVAKMTEVTKGTVPFWAAAATATTAAREKTEAFILRLG